MEHIRRVALALALGLFTSFLSGPAMGQHATTSAAPANFAPEQACVTWSGASVGSGSLVPCAGLASGGPAQGVVVTGDQAYTPGSTQTFNMTTTGRIKVGLSSATNIDPAARATTTIGADLFACTYRVPISWTAGWTGALQCDSAGNLMVNNATLPPGASTEATLSGLLAKFPASLGAKTGAASLSVVQNSDTPFSVTPSPSAAAAFGIAPTTVTAASANALKTTAGNLYSVNVVNNSTAIFIVAYDSATTPAAASALTASLTRYCYPIPASNGFDKAWPIPLAFTAGIQLLASTSCTTYTVPGTLPVLLAGQFK